MSSRSSRKRDASSVASSLSQDDQQEQLDDVDTPGPPPTKKRASRTTASEKATKKAARMERNRIAAQASRDRKKNYTDHLESRIAELEAQLANSTSTPASSTSSTALTLLPSPPTHFLNLQPLPLGVVDPEVVRLREENESLRTQLELEKLESKGLQLRLSSLEGKFGRLEKLLTQLSSGGGSIMTQQPETRQIVEVQTGNKTELVGGGEGVGKDNVCSLARRATLQRTMSLQLRIQFQPVLSSLPRSQPLRLPNSTSNLSSPSSTTTTSPLPRQPSTSPSSTPLPTQPSLHQILSSIKILPPPLHSRSLRSTPPSSTIRSSLKPGKIGLLPLTNNRSRKSPNRRILSICSNSSGRNKREVPCTAVLRLYVSQNRGRH
ncbi:hypothetical protein JCM5350_005613 [Sporobolomyces pararoseus]